MKLVLPGLLLLLLVAILASAIVCVIAKAKHVNVSRIIFYECICWTIVYIIALLYVTLFSRRTGTERLINIIPFQEIVLIIKQHRYMDLEYVLLNIIMLIPGGILVGYILQYLRKKTFRNGILVCLGTIIPIEFIQYYSYRGAFDIDDLIYNTIGFLLGYYIISKIIRLKRQHKS